MKKFITLLVAIVVLSVYSMAEVRIGFVNTQQIISSTKIGMKAAKKLEKRQKEERDKLLAFQAKISKLEEEKSSPSTNKEKKQAMSREIFSAKKELKKKYDQLTADFQKYSQNELKLLENKINPIIQDIGRAKGYTAIYDVQRSGTIYIDNSVNITKTVIDAINKKYPE